MINESGKVLTEFGLLFKDSETLKDINERTNKSSNLFEEIEESRRNLQLFNKSFKMNLELKTMK